MKEFDKLIKDFRKARILVIGDLILDEYIWGDVSRISPEAPVPVVWAKKRNFMPGGAANVASNIVSLGAKVCLLGVIGDYASADTMLTELKKRKIPTGTVFIDRHRHTTLKTRIIAGHQQIVRVDWEDTHPVPKKINDKIINFVTKNIDKFDAVIIEDYGKGVINIELLEKVVKLGAKKKKVITVDPKEEHFQYYRGVTSITPNRRELENAVRNLKIKDTSNKFKICDDKLFSDKEIENAARQILKYLGLDSILVTLGENGMWLFENNGHDVKIPTVAQEVFDVSGAGDAVIACFTLALASGAQKKKAAALANIAAGIVVGKLGTVPVTKEELLQKIHKL
ncbi:MAG: D-glycero-beta-D-manno-heptose-7-phosphate kinase [Candidatus Omnitrophota bacterium]|jgi:D-beta-D-heptose 7-phosphate kinase/D-beta-D-heptose 1-phosphate adenosyltransferase|nr:MAG: D-glycero-beta-D-manno-heptose-7-phosphate kinase [Candidatus Omnitrophota bacterium]